MIRLIIIFSICLTCLLSNYHVFLSVSYQSELLDDAKDDKFSINKDELNNLNFYYPSLALNSVPILTYLSRYDTNVKNYDQAINKLNLSIIKNPYSLYSHYLLARNYIFNNDYINAENTLEYIFTLSPQIESSSSLYFFILGENKRLDKLKSFKSIVVENENRNIWLFYLSSIEKNISTKDDKMFHTQLINIFENKF